jgi:hypothetical protein
VNDKQNQAAVSVSEGVTFIDSKIINTLVVNFGALDVTGALVSGEGVQAQAFAKVGNNYTFDLSCTNDAKVGQRDLTVNVTVNGQPKTAKLQGAVTAARLFVETLKFTTTNEIMYRDASENVADDYYWMVGAKIDTQVHPKIPKVMPVAFMGHPPLNGTMPTPTIEIVLKSDPEVQFTAPISLTGTWAVSEPAVKWSGSFILNTNKSLVANAALPETNPVKKQADIKWVATIGTETSPVADSKLGPCYFLWAKPIWTSVQTDTDGRDRRIAVNNMTQHRLDKIFDIIGNASTTDTIVAALHAFVSGPNTLINRIVEEKKDQAKYNINDWRAFISEKYYLQCGERAALLERMLVMIGIDARHVHIYVPATNWKAIEGAEVFNFPSAIWDYGILYHDSIGDNRGEGCVALANTNIANPNATLKASANEFIKRKYVFGRYYAMYSDLTAADSEAYDAAKGVTGGYKILLKLAIEDDLWCNVRSGMMGSETWVRKKYNGWKTSGFPKP